MSTHPYIPLYVDDYEAATAHLSVEEDGVYSRLIRLCWRTPGCSLPNDMAWIARKIRLSPADFERIAGPVLAEFFTLVRGRWIQRRLKREYDDISRKQNARKLAGKKGGAAKARKAQGKSPSNATVLPPDTRAFPEPYPEPEPEKEVEGAQVLPFAEAGGQAAVPRKGSRIKPDWAPSADNLAFAMAQGFTDREVERIAAKFRDYWTAASGKNAAKLDWTATWRNWVRDEADRRPKPTSTTGRQSWV